MNMFWDSWGHAFRGPDLVGLSSQLYQYGRKFVGLHQELPTLNAEQRLITDPTARTKFNHYVKEDTTAASHYQLTRQDHNIYHNSINRSETGPSRSGHSYSCSGSMSKRIGHLSELVTPYFTANLSKSRFSFTTRKPLRNTSYASGLDILQYTGSPSVEISVGNEYSPKPDEIALDDNNNEGFKNYAFDYSTESEKDHNIVKVATSGDICQSKDENLTKDMLIKTQVNDNYSSMPTQSEKNTNVIFDDVFEGTVDIGGKTDKAHASEYSSMPLNNQENTRVVFDDIFDESFSCTSSIAENISRKSIIGKGQSNRSIAGNCSIKLSDGKSHNIKFIAGKSFNKSSVAVKISNKKFSAGTNLHTKPAHEKSESIKSIARISISKKSIKEQGQGLKFSAGNSISVKSISETRLHRKSTEKYGTNNTPNMDSGSNSAPRTDIWPHYGPGPSNIKQENLEMHQEPDPDIQALDSDNHDNAQDLSSSYKVTCTKYTDPCTKSEINTNTAKPTTIWYDDNGFSKVQQLTSWADLDKINGITNPEEHDTQHYSSESSPVLYRELSFCDSSQMRGIITPNTTTTRITLINYNIEKHQAKLVDLMESYKTAFRTNFPCTPQFIDTQNIYVCTYKRKQIMLGHGVYGKVFLGHDNYNSRFVAIKVFTIEENNRYNIITEASMHLAMSRLSPIIPKFYGLGMISKSSDEDLLEIVHISEFIGNEESGTSLTLDKYFRCQEILLGNYGYMQIDYETIFRIFEIICSELSVLHEAGFVVNDMKMNNIIVSPHLDNSSRTYLKINIIDFGTTTYQCNIGLSYPSIEELRDCFPHIAPESKQYGCCFPVSDVYSVGRMMQVVKEAFGLTQLQPAIDVLMKRDYKHRVPADVAAVLLRHWGKQCRNYKT